MIMPDEKAEARQNNFPDISPNNLTRKVHRLQLSAPQFFVQAPGCLLDFVLPEDQNV